MVKRLAFLAAALECALLVLSAPAVAATPLPDLTVADIWSSGTQIFYRIKNAGQAAAGSPNLPPNYYCALFLDGKQVAEDHITTILNPGQQVDRSFEYKWVISPPQDTVRVVADSRQQVTESNEQNNALEETWAAQLPDLFVTGIELDAENRVSFGVKNAGTAPLPQGWVASAEVSFDGVKQGTVDLRSPTSRTGGGMESQGGTSTYLTSFIIKAETSLRVIADVTDSVAELDEKNNSLTVKLAPRTTTTPPTSTSTTVTAKPTPSTSQTVTTIIPTKTSPTTTTAPTTTTTPAQTPTTSKPTTTTPPVYKPPFLAESLRITRGPEVSDITQDTAVVTWTTNVAITSNVVFDTVSGRYGRTAGSPQAVKDHQVTLGNLQSEVVYQLTVLDDSGTNLGRAVMFTTDGGGDKASVRLVLPQNLSGTKVPVRANVSGSANGVAFYLDGSLAYTDYSYPYEWSCDTTGLPGGRHSFAARAFGSGGGVAEDVRTGNVQHQVAAALSPVKVHISTPEEGADVIGVVGVSTQAYPETGLGMDLFELLADGVSLRRIEISHPRTSMTRLGFEWDTAELTLGEHILTYRARDVAGNWGTDSLRVNVAAKPVISLTREVRRQGNYFVTTINISNTGGFTASGVTVTDTHRGFQAVEGVSTQNAGGTWFRSLDGEVAQGDRYWYSTIAFTVTSLAPGEARSFRYYLVPVLADPREGTPMPVIGATTKVEYTAGSDSFTRYFHAAWSDGDEIEAACAASDYLIITCTEKLWSASPAGEVGHLLSTMGLLAVNKNGVLGYVAAETADAGAWRVSRVMDPNEDNNWADCLAPQWVGEGYLLIVGEWDIIPSYNWQPLCDYNYTHISGAGNMDLRVGRIIGRGASALAIPIYSAIFGEYFGSSALLVSGPEDTWEPTILDIEMAKTAAERAGLTVGVIHAEYWTTEYVQMAEAVRIKKAPQSERQQTELAQFLLRRLGAAGAADDLSGYTANQLCAWLLWERGMLTPGTARADAIASADAIVTERGNGQGLNGAMWGVMHNVLMRGPGDRLFTTEQLAAWVLWEEASPRGPLTSASLGTATIGGASRQVASLTLNEMLDNAAAIITPARLAQSKERASAIQADNAPRGDTVGWSYVYCSDNHAVELARSTAVKVAAKGRDIIVFCGHGDPGGWAGVLTCWAGTGSDIEPIDFGRKAPVVIGFSCLTGYYADEPSIARAFLENGAAAYLGATIVMPFAFMDELVRSRLWRSWDKRGSIGEIMFQLKYDTTPAGQWSWDFDHYYNLYGDPKYGLR